MTGILRNKADRRSIAFVMTYFILVALLWFQVFSNPVVTVTLFILTVMFSFIGATITHNTLHYPIFRKRWMNRIFQAILTLTYGFPVSEYIPGHNLSHHRFTQTRKDVMRTTKVQYRSNLVNFLAFFPTVAIDVTRANYQFIAATKNKNPAWYRQLLFEMIVCWGSKAVLLLVDWRKCVLFIILPHMFSLWAITTVNYLQHDGCDQNSPYNHSRNFVGKIFNWFTFNNGFHGMHHEEPGLHWSLLQKRHAEVLHPYIHPSLEHPNLFLYLFQAVIFPGKRIAYDGKPIVLPVEGADENWIGALEQSSLA